MGMRTDTPLSVSLWQLLMSGTREMIVEYGIKVFVPDEDKHYWDFPNDLVECAWGIIANAHEGDWSMATEEWRTAAERWRDAYHLELKKMRRTIGETEDDLE